MKKLTVFLLIILFGFTLGAQEKHALVIGNADYTNFGMLNNPINDAIDMADVLYNLGFNVDILLDANRIEMEEAVTSLRQRLDASQNSYGFFYYAGHGVQSRNGINFLIPVDADIRTENLLADRGVSVDFILTELADAGNELNMIVLDACRNFPANWDRSGNRGLSYIGNPPRGSIIMYATAAGATADEGEGRNGLFTSQLLNNLANQELNVRDVFDFTGDDVYKVSGGTQHPAISSNYFLAGSIYLGLGPSETLSAARPTPNPRPISPVQPSPTPLPSMPGKNNSGIGYGFMNLALGLGSYLQGDIAGGAITTVGFAAALGLVAWEFNGRGSDDGAIALISGIGVGAATVIFGFVKPILYSRNHQLASVMDKVNISLVSSEYSMKALVIGYSHSF